MLTGPGRVESFSVAEKEIVFSLASLKSPAELYTLTVRNGDLRELSKWIEMKKRVDGNRSE